MSDAAEYTPPKVWGKRGTSVGQQAHRTAIANGQIGDWNSAIGADAVRRGGVAL